ncbi:MAG TPA: class I SAM-dependent methyltransferase [Gaiellaceae bacterium]|nr:class I SAM-dependent methyltransferase [Gaiellaceae bacterium]
MDDDDDVAREYASLDRLQLRRLDRTGWLRFDDLDEEQTLLAALAEVSPRRVLDVGCGDGRIPRLYTAPEVVCVDRSQAAVAAARARGLDARPADVRELPFADGAVDAVTCNHTLYHVDDRDRAVAELARVLRPGGRFVGIYSAPAHLRELWSVVAPDWLRDSRGTRDLFDAESRLPVLERHFATVDRRFRGGSVLWVAREDLQRYLDAYIEMIGPLEAPDGPYPFVATRAKCVFVADR